MPHRLPLRWYKSQRFVMISLIVGLLAMCTVVVVKLYRNGPF
jgi:hypothetical protein